MRTRTCTNQVPYTRTRAGGPAETSKQRWNATPRETAVANGLPTGVVIAGVVIGGGVPTGIVVSTRRCASSARTVLLMHHVRLFERRLGFFIFTGGDLLSTSSMLALALPRLCEVGMLGGVSAHAPVLTEDTGAASDTIDPLSVAVLDLQSCPSCCLGDGGGLVNGLAGAPPEGRIVPYVSGPSNMKSS